MLTANAAQGYGAVRGSYDNPEAATERVLLLDESTGLIRNATERVYAARDFLRNKADDVFGSRLQSSENKASLQPKSPARAEGLRMAGSDLHQALAELESEMERFRAI